MIIEKDAIKCESIFNDDRTHRFVLKKIWAKEKPLVCIIMLNPCTADNVMIDTTTSLVINNVARLEKYGGVVIVNMYSLITPKLNFNSDYIEEMNHEDNDKYIIKSIEESEIVIGAWGRSVDNNRHIAERATEVFNMLIPYEDKLYILSDGTRVGLHPLTPSLKRTWLLEKISLAGQIKA